MTHLAAIVIAVSLALSGGRLCDHGDMRMQDMAAMSGQTDLAPSGDHPGMDDSGSKLPPDCDGALDCKNCLSGAAAMPEATPFDALHPGLVQALASAADLVGAMPGSDPPPPRARAMHTA